MEHTFQQQILSEISNYQIRIHLIKKALIPQNHEELDHEDLLLTTVQINEWNTKSAEAIENYTKRIDMLRHEYEAITGRVCPV